MKTVVEPAKNIPIIEEVDICVLGGSCTGVFAAVRAARLGAKVAIIEKQNCFGGVATSSLVNIWHTAYDFEFKQQIVAGLSLEIVDRMKKRNTVVITDRDVSKMFTFNSEELKIELDELVRESNITPYLHTFFCAPFVNQGQLEGVTIENKSGRSAITAKIFIDATGDGDLAFRLGISSYTYKNIQPPTTCAKIYGLDGLGSFNWKKAVHEHGSEFGLHEDWGWNAIVPNVPDVRMCAEGHIFGVDCSDAKQLIYAEMEGRRYNRAIMDTIRKYGPSGRNIEILALASYIGVRDTRHIKCKYQLTQEDVLNGRRFEDAIANGSERVDIHHSDKSGITFRYLDGVEEVIMYRDSTTEKRRWRPDQDINPPFWQIPYRSIVPGKYNNLLIAGRMLDADEGAFGAVRQMLYLNQVGEAAGVAAYLSLSTGKGVEDIDTQLLRKTLKDGGSIII